MDSGLKQKILDEIMEHIGSSQGNDLKSLLDKSKMPQDMMEGSPKEEAMESPMDEKAEMMGKPKGLSVEKVSIMGKPEDSKMNPLSGKSDDLADELTKPDDMSMKGDDDELSDDELEELLKKLV